MFKEWTPTDHVTDREEPELLERPTAPPTSTRSTFKPIADTTATLNALQAGDIDLASVLQPDRRRDDQERHQPPVIDRGSACNLFHLAMNQTHKPFDNAKIREAVAYAINRQALVDTFYGGEAGVVHRRGRPRATSSRRTRTCPTYDVEKAKALIAESGVTATS